MDWLICGFNRPPEERGDSWGQPSVPFGGELVNGGRLAGYSLQCHEKNEAAADWARHRFRRFASTAANADSGVLEFFSKRFVEQRCEKGLQASAALGLDIL